MPKVLKLLLIKRRYIYTNKIYYYSLAMPIKYTYYIKKKILKCFINTSIEEYIIYIIIYAECSL